MDYSAVVRSIELSLVLVAVYGVFGVAWHQVRAWRIAAMKPRILRTRAAGLIAILGLTGGVLVATHGLSVLGDYAFFCGVSAVVAVYLAVQLAFGLFLLRRKPLSILRFTRLETLVLAWLLAAGLAGILLFSLSVLGVSPRLVAGVALAAMAVVARTELKGMWAFLIGPARPSRSGMQWAAIWWGAFGAVAVGVFFLNWSRVASPAWMSDEVMVHLASVKAYAVADGMPFIPQMRSSFLYPLMQCLFLPLWYISPDLGPRLLEAAFWIVSGLLTYSLAIRTGLAQQLARLATLLVMATPLFTFLAGICFLGLPSTGFALAVYLIALQSLRCSPLSRSRCNALAVLLGVFMAFLYWVKLQAWGTALPVAVVFLVALVGRKISLRQAIRIFALAASIAIVLAVPHLLRNELEIGNPVFPLLRGYLGEADYIFSGEDVATLEGLWSKLGMGRSVGDFLRLPGRLVLEESKFGAVKHWGLGVVWLAAWPLAMVGVSRRNWWAIAFVLGIAVPWFYLGQELRYLIYVFPFAAMVAARGVERLWGERAGVISAGALLIFVSWSLQGSERTVTPGSLGIRGAGRERFLESRVPGYAAIESINDRAASDDVVCAVEVGHAAYFLDDPANLVCDWFGKYRISELIEYGAEGKRFRAAETVVATLRDWGVDYLLINTGGRASDLRNLLLVDDAELRKYLSTPVNHGGVLAYEFDPRGGFSGNDSVSFEDTEASIPWSWRLAQGEPVVDSEAQRITLHPGDSVQLFLNASRVRTQAIYEVSAYTAAGQGPLVLQAVWLPEGGWEARGPDGSLLRVIESISKVIGEKATSAQLLIQQPGGMSQLLLYLVNQGEAEIVIEAANLRQSA